MVADRLIRVTDLIGALNAASEGQKTALRTALGIPSDGVAEQFLSIDASGQFDWLNPIAYLEGKAPEARLDATAIKGLSSTAQGPNYAASLIGRYGLLDGDILVRSGTGFAGVSGVPDTPATALQMAAATDEATSLNPKNAGLWTAQTTLAYANPATIDWSGAMSGSSLSGHSRNVRMAATGSTDIRVGAICPGQEGKPFLVGVTNSGGGARTIGFVNHGSGASVELAAGVTNPGLGSTAGNELWAVGFITATGATGGVWKICRFIQKN